MLCVVLKNVVLALKKIHVRGDEAETLVNVIKNLETLIKVIDENPNQNENAEVPNDYKDRQRKDI